MGHALGLLIPPVESAAFARCFPAGSSMPRDEVWCQPDLSGGNGFGNAAAAGYRGSFFASCLWLCPREARLLACYPNQVCFPWGGNKERIHSAVSGSRFQARPGNHTQAPLCGRGDHVLTAVLVVLCRCAGRARKGPWQNTRVPTLTQGDGNALSPLPCKTDAVPPCLGSVPPPVRVLWGCI